MPSLETGSVLYGECTSKIVEANESAPEVRDKRVGWRQAEFRQDRTNDAEMALITRRQIGFL